MMGGLLSVVESQEMLLAREPKTRGDYGLPLTLAHHATARVLAIQRGRSVASRKLLKAMEELRSLVETGAFIMKAI